MHQLTDKNTNTCQQLPAQPNHHKCWCTCHPLDQLALDQSEDKNKGHPPTPLTCPAHVVSWISQRRKTKATHQNCQHALTHIELQISLRMSMRTPHHQQGHHLAHLGAQSRPKTSPTTITNHVKGLTPAHTWPTIQTELPCTSTTPSTPSTALISIIALPAWMLCPMQSLHPVTFPSETMLSSATTSATTTSENQASQTIINPVLCH